MGIYNILPSEVDEVDIIIAGGGTTGCIIASRLSDADPNLTILVIEGGPDNYDMPKVVNPAYFLSNIVPGSNTAIFYQGNKSPSTANRDLVIPCGGVLGGGSSINFLIYSRAQESDFDSWNVVGWSAREMLPYLKRVETYHGPRSDEFHGYTGPINVAREGFSVTKLEDDFIRSAEKLGWPENEDLQAFGATNSVQRALRYVSPNGKRQDTAHQYLHPRIRDGHHPKLHVLVECQVERVLFEGKRAMGVTYRRNPALTGNADTSNKATLTIKARKMVILTCGGCGTSPVLERSGVGSPEVLERAGIPIVAAVPGVGSNFKDHPGLMYAYKSSLGPTETMDATLRDLLATQEVNKSNPMIGWNSIAMTSKIRPSDADVAALGPELQRHWSVNFKNIPDKPMSILALINAFPGAPIGVPPGQYMGVSAFSAYPCSRGYVHITGPRVDDALDLETGYLTDPDGIDVKQARWAYKAQREIIRRMKTFRGEWASWHPPFPIGSKAECIETSGPLPEMVPNIDYSPEDDAILDQWIRESIGSFWHPVGTCKMGPLDENGVVDENLGVYGTECLKVADLSILPEIVGANTNNTALIVGEKAADIFIGELGLRRI